MCEYFHVTLQYLLDFSDQRTYEIENEEILKLFYTLPEDKRTNFSELLEAYVFWINNKDKKEPWKNQGSFLPSLYDSIGHGHTNHKKDGDL